MILLAATCAGADITEAQRDRAATLAAREPSDKPRPASKTLRMFKCDSELDALAAAMVNAERLPGGTVARVAATGSMLPCLDEKTFVVARSVYAHEVQLGDVLVFNRQNGDTVIHRVVERIGKKRWRMKGDNNDVPDIETIGKSQLVGRVELAFRY